MADKGVNVVLGGANLLHGQPQHQSYYGSSACIEHGDALRRSMKKAGPAGDTWFILDLPTVALVQGRDGTFFKRRCYESSLRFCSRLVYRGDEVFGYGTNQEIYAHMFTVGPNGGLAALSYRATLLNSFVTISLCTTSEELDRENAAPLDESRVPIAVAIVQEFSHEQLQARAHRDHGGGREGLPFN